MPPSSKRQRSGKPQHADPLATSMTKAPAAVAAKGHTNPKPKQPKQQPKNDQAPTSTSKPKHEKKHDKKIAEFAPPAPASVSASATMQSNGNTSHVSEWDEEDDIMFASYSDEEMMGDDDDDDDDASNVEEVDSDISPEDFAKLVAAHKAKMGDLDDEDENEEEEDDEEGEFDEEAEEGDEGDEEASDESDESDGVDDDGNVNVDFDVREFYKRHVPACDYFIANAIPDPDRTIERHDAAEAIRRYGAATSLVTAGDDDGDDEEGDESDAESAETDPSTFDNEDTEDVYACVSLVDCATPKTARTEKLQLTGGKEEEALVTAALNAIPKLLETNCVATLSEGMHVGALLRRVKGEKAKGPASLLFFNERMRNIPPLLVAQLHGNMVDEFKSFVQTPEGRKYQAVEHVIVLAKVQSKTAIKEDEEEAEPVVSKGKKAERLMKKGSVGAAQKEQKKKRRLEGASELSFASLSSDYFFWRWEDELLFKRRDERVSVTAHKFGRTYDDQPEAEIPLAVAFAVTKAEFNRNVEAELPHATKLMQQASGKAPEAKIVRH